MTPVPRSPLAVAAVLLDVVAIGVLVADVVAAYQRDVMWALLLSAAGIGFAIAGSVTSGIHLARRFRTVPRWLAVTVIVLVTLAVVPIGGTLLALAVGATPNPAADAEARLGRTVEAAGGHRLCGSGDPGLGPDNTQPYFDSAYEVPNGSSVQVSLAAQAERLGWTVSSDPSGDATRTTPRVQIDAGGTTATGVCDDGSTVRASGGEHLLELQVLLPYRR